VFDLIMRFLGPKGIKDVITCKVPKGLHALIP
jgi:hypothetical protein